MYTYIYMYKYLHSTNKAASSTVFTLERSIFLANAKDAAFLTNPSISAPVFICVCMSVY
jgi:hypothetical protein